MFRADFEAGKLYWKEREDRSSKFNKRYAGKEAGSFDKHQGYLNVVVDGVKTRVHRVLLAMHYGECPTSMQADHINGDRTDNSISNLRLVTQEQNNKNRTISRKNKTGIPGVWYNKARGRYEVTVGGKNKDYGQRKRFKDFFDACCYRKSLEVAEGYHENHGRYQ